MGEQNKPKPGGAPFNWRGLTSFIIALGFLVLAFSGVILYLTPQGRVANWTGWSLLGLGKEQWASLHTVSGLLFLVAAVVHLYFNWKVFLHYIRTRAGGFNLKREAVVAVAVTGVLLVGTVLEIPPFRYITVMNDGIKAYWESRSVRAPYAHAEASTLAEFAERTGNDVAALKERLAAAGLESPDDSATVSDLAARLRVSPGDLYRQLGVAADRPGGSGRRAGNGGNQGGGGSGRGGQTLEEVCAGHAIDPERALGLLLDKGITASPDDTLRSIAERGGITPQEVRAIIGAGSGGGGRNADRN